MTRSIGSLFHNGWLTNCVFWHTKQSTVKAPAYLIELCKPVAESESRHCSRLSSTGDLLVPRTNTSFADRAFAYAGPRASPRLVDCSVPQGSVLGPQGFIAYTEDLAELIEEHLLGHHMYADDTQLIAHLTINAIPSVATRLQNSIEAIQVWCNSRRLQLNPTKTELIWFGSKTNLKKIADLNLNLYIGLDIIKPVNVVRDLGVYMDSELSMKHHISTVVRACFFHLRRLKSIRRILGADVTSGLVSAFVTTRIDYCNSILAALPQSSIDPLQRVQNAAARLITGTGTREHITPALRSLHWLPVKFRLTFKLCVLMHLVHIGRAPTYLSDMVMATADLPSRGRLRSSNTFRYELPILKRKFGERGFSYAGPKAWNNFLFALQELTDTCTFKRQLKTHICLHWHIHNFVEAPLVTLSVNGVWNNDNVM